MAYCDDISIEESEYWEKERIKHCMKSLQTKIGPKPMNHVGGAGYKFNVSGTYVVELDDAHKIIYVHDENGADPCQSILDEIRSVQHEILHIQSILDTHDHTVKMLKRAETSLSEITMCQAFQPNYLEPTFLESITVFSKECNTNYKLEETNIIKLAPSLDIKKMELGQKKEELQKKYIEVLST
jgi:hypothetical protein